MRSCCRLKMESTRTCLDYSQRDTLSLTTTRRNRIQRRRNLKASLKILLIRLVIGKVEIPGSSWEISTDYVRRITEHLLQPLPYFISIQVFKKIISWLIRRSLADFRTRCLTRRKKRSTGMQSGLLKSILL
jgi:hypothetical protein